MRRVAILLLMFIGGIARAEEPPTPPAPPPAPAPEAVPAAKSAPRPNLGQVADAVLAAVQGKEDAALATLAAQEEPDPWLVADELIRRGELDAADAFARAAPRVDVERLPAYVASRRGKPDDKARRERLAAVNAHVRAGRFADALEALGAEEPGPIEDMVGVRLAMARGAALGSLVRYEQAAAAFLAAGEAAERLGWLTRASQAFGSCAESAFRGSVFPAMRVALERDLAICEARGDKPGAAAALGNMGNLQYALGDAATALATFERALVVMEALGDKAGVALTLGNLGNAHLMLGDAAKALNMQKRALAAKLALKDEPGAAGTLLNIGNVHYVLGEYANALAAYERALALQEALGRKVEVATALLNLGNVYDSLGDHARALSTYERALATQEALGDRLMAASTLGNIGLAYASLGDDAKALLHHERALAAKEALGDRAGAAVTLVNIASAYLRFGDPTKALATYERALEAMEAVGNKRGAAVTLAGIGRAHAALGDTSKAIRFLERAVRAAEKLGANDVLASTLGKLARVRLGAGDAGRAMSDAHTAVRLLKTLVGGLGEEQGATARGGYTLLFSTGLAAAAKAGDASEAAFFLESGRAGSLLESLDARDALRHAAIPDGLRLAEAAARRSEARALVAYRKSLDAGDSAATRALNEELKAARANVQDVVERIQREAKRAASLWYPVATPAEDIQGFLAAGEALVLYGLTELDDAAFALVLTREEARIVSLGSSSEIVAECEGLELHRRDADPAAALARLRDLLVTPLGLQKDTKRLIVSPEGPLSYVPFALLAPDLVVAYASSGSTYGVLREEGGKRGTSVLALADADYQARFNPTALDLYAPEAAALAPADPTRGGRRLQALPGTRQEALAIADVRLLGAEASETGLRAALAAKKDRWHAVHFACHGLVNPDRPTLSALALTPAGEDDGFLTALEVLKMEIPADLVVLSACETGKGKIARGEGIVGLTRAFMYAGSPRVICSLWKVDDEATRALMTRFYELWNPKDGSPGLPTADALKQAQEFVRSQAQWTHPYYWAAWVLWGLPG